jgi:cell filamentation protein
VTFGGYDAFEDPYCYKGTNTLKNRLSLRDPEKLTAFELEMTSLRAVEPLPDGRYGPAHYRRVHWHLFRDVYPWAGRYRTVRTAKNGNAFCFPEHIEDQMRLLFERLSQLSFLPGVTPNAFTASLALFLSDLNAIHPFREGNGRTQLAFCHMLGSRAERSLDLSRIEATAFLAAMIESFAGRQAPLQDEIATLLV